MKPTTTATLQIHFCVLLWGFTAILGKLISLAALPLVWWRMLIVVAVLALVPSVLRSLRALPRAAVARVRRRRRSGRAALADVLWRHQARECVGGRDLHRARGAVHGARRAAGHADAVLGARSSCSG